MSNQIQSVQLVEGIKFTIFENEYGVCGDLIRQRWSPKNLKTFEVHFFVNKSLWRSLKEEENDIAAAITAEIWNYQKTLAKNTLLKILKQNDDIIIQIIKFDEKEKCYDYLSSLKLPLEAWNKLMSSKNEIDVHLSMKRRSEDVPTTTLYRIKYTDDNNQTKYGIWNTSIGTVQSQVEKKKLVAAHVDIQKESFQTPSINDLILHSCLYLLKVEIEKQGLHSCAVSVELFEKVIVNIKRQNISRTTMVLAAVLKCADICDVGCTSKMFFNLMNMDLKSMVYPVSNTQRVIYDILEVTFGNQ
ncbi:unnamed protein product [Owenia fusiformis]|uniref:Uncharacterized protein n=1 Tax=Owenia fusiformis TaxID=6347 RepID=A0A8J1TI21_OWEFU|nr:unnamed protein product [Owenia fusiformis]